MDEIVIGSGAAGRNWASERKQALAVDSRAVSGHGPFVQMNGEKLALPDRSVSKVYMDFLINGASIGKTAHATLLADSSRSFQPSTLALLNAEKSTTAVRLLKEAYRVLAPGGTVTVVETTHNIQIISRIASKIGFQVGVVEQPGHEDMNRSDSLRRLLQNSESVGRIVLRK